MYNLKLIKYFRNSFVKDYFQFKLFGYSYLISFTVASLIFKTLKQKFYFRYPERNKRLATWQKVYHKNTTLRGKFTTESA